MVLLRGLQEKVAAGAVAGCSRELGRFGDISVSLSSCQPTCELTPSTLYAIGPPPISPLRDFGRGPLVSQIVGPLVKDRYNNVRMSISHVMGVDTGALFVARTGVRGSMTWFGLDARQTTRPTALHCVLRGSRR